jgi:Sec-independent protein secretion pathway component TatC
MKKQRILRVVKKVTRLNLGSQKSLRIIAIRTLPFVLSPPQDINMIEQIALCDTMSILVQVGIVLYGLSTSSRQ